MVILPHHAAERGTQPKFNLFRQQPRKLLHFFTKQINLNISLSHITKTKIDLGYSETKAHGPEFQQ